MNTSSQSTKSSAYGRTRLSGLALAALAGAAVMVVELGVARVLTPVFGGSISVWAIVIATTMLALALGYAFGGYRADRRGGVRVAAQAAAVGALLCAAIPLVRVPLIVYTIELDTLVGATISALALIAPSLFFLSQVSPALIKGLAGDGISHVGVTAGGVYAISTVGSLLGTLAAVWLFLYLPVQAGFIGTALLVILPVALLQPRAAAAALIAGAVMSGLSWLPWPGPSEPGDATTSGLDYKLIAKRTSAYGEIRVVQKGDRYRYMIVNGFDQGGIDLHSGESAYLFDEGMVSVARLYVSAPERALIIGLGPGVITAALKKAGMAVDTVEIDPAVWRAAEEYFGFEGSVTVADGRRFLERSNAFWDIIFVDAFAGGSPPWQLYTTEAFRLYASHLNEGGVIVLNFVGSHLDAGQRPALEAVVATARQVFRVADVYPDPWEPDEYPTRNIFIAVANHPRRRAVRAGDPRDAYTFSEAFARSSPVDIDNGRVLTDDSAPLDPLVRRTSQILRNRVREYLPVRILLH